MHRCCLYVYESDITGLRGGRRRKGEERGKVRRERGGGKKEEEKSRGKEREEGRYGREEKRRVWEGERERKECRESKGELHVRGGEAECCVALAGIALRTYPLRLQHFSQGALLRVLSCSNTSRCSLTSSKMELKVHSRTTPVLW